MVILADVSDHPSGATVKEANMHKKITKTDAVIQLLRRSSGATIAQIQKSTGWQPQSVRAALTRLRKNKNWIERGANAKGVTVYRMPEGLA